MLKKKEIELIKQIGINIRKERTKCKLSQAQVAFELKTSTKQFQRIENGEINTGVLNILKICKILNCKVDAIIK